MEQPASQIKPWIAQIVSCQKKPRNAGTPMLFCRNEATQHRPMRTAYCTNHPTRGKMLNKTFMSQGSSRALSLNSAPELRPIAILSISLLTLGLLLTGPA